MPVYASANNDGDFEKAPTGMQQAVCAHVFDIGLQKGEWKGKPLLQHKCIIVWELAEKFKDGDFAGKPFMVSKYYTLSLGEKSNLRKDLESWRGQGFSPEELISFDLEKLIGANCLLNIVSTENDKRKVQAVVPLMKGQEPLKITDTVPSAKMLEWIGRERAKAVEPTQATQTAEEPKDDSGLPF